MRNKESKKWVLTDSRHEYCIKLLIGSNKEAEKGTWETKYLDRTQDYRFYSTEVQITQPYKMITNLRLNDFIAELGELKKHHCCSIFVNLFAIFDHSLIREAPFWNVLFLYGHCPNSFRPPPSSVKQMWKKKCSKYGNNIWKQCFSKRGFPNCIQLSLSVLGKHPWSL